MYSHVNKMEEIRSIRGNKKNLLPQISNPRTLATEVNIFSSITRGKYLKTKHCNKLSLLYLCLLVLQTSGDTETNPGPETHASDTSPNHTKYPCGTCCEEVTWNTRGMCCDTCDTWYHMDCQGLQSHIYECLNNSNIAWDCIKCGMPNFSTCIFDWSSFISLNTFDSLESSTDEHHSPGVPQAASSPVATKPHKKRNSNITRGKPIRVVNINCQSLCKKGPELENLIDTVKPDIVIGTESWLKPEIQSSEIFPPDFSIYRNDRKTGEMGGGVFIAVHNNLVSYPIEAATKNCEEVWAGINISGSKTIHVGAFYRPPTKGAIAEELVVLDHLKASIDKVSQTQNHHIWLAGDFNLPDIDWSSNRTKASCKSPTLHQKLIDVAEDSGLQQVVNAPTRGENTLDLFFTNNDTLVNRVATAPGIGDHDMVYLDINLKAKLNKKPRRRIYLHKKTNKEELDLGLQELKDNFISTSNNENDPNILWNAFKSDLRMNIEKSVPSKLTNPKQTLPYMTTEIKRLIRKRDKLYKKMKRKPATSANKHYKNIKHLVQRKIRQAYWSYVEDIISPTEIDKSPKRFWSYIKSKKQDSMGVAPLRHENQLVSSSKGKADILNNQFKSVFTKEDTAHIPSCGRSNIPTMPSISITEQGVNNLLHNLKPNKASGPDEIPARILRDFKHHIAPVLTIIFQKSLSTGIVPTDWKTAIVCPVFKKGERYKASNYRPVSLTCICCKIMEHIIASQLMKHLDSHRILHENQHGFRSRRSCDTQLITFMDELCKNKSSNIRTDMLILDFSKAFDTVPHKRLISKLQHYGVKGNTSDWILSFLSGRSQSVVVDGARSESCEVSSGVPQGSVLGPILFLVYINDLPDTVTSDVRLFADDCILYRKIKKDTDIDILQQDLTALHQWESDWQMSFNAEKCNYMKIAGKVTTPHKYLLHGHQLEECTDSKYLGVNINNNLSWGQHCANIAAKGNRSLGMLRRNLRTTNINLKSVAYKGLVRSGLEYASTVWDPHQCKDINKVESVQRRAARYVCNDYNQEHSVSAMMSRLEWDTLQARRQQARLSMFYKIIYDKVDIVGAAYYNKITRPTRNSHTHSIHRPTTKHNYYKFSFFPRTIAEWNSLSEDCVTQQSLDQFKAKLSGETVQGYNY